MPVNNRKTASISQLSFYLNLMPGKSTACKASQTKDEKQTMPIIYLHKTPPNQYNIINLKMSGNSSYPLNNFNCTDKKGKHAE